VNAANQSENTAYPKRTGEAIDTWTSRGHAAFIGYLPVGFPDLETSILAAKELAAAGADIIELGLPLLGSVDGRWHDPEGGEAGTRQGISGARYFSSGRGSGRYWGPSPYR
jgi:tryptophan synthase, alpha chain (EC 4.2.1.20)